MTNPSIFRINIDQINGSRKFVGRARFPEHFLGVGFLGLLFIAMIPLSRFADEASVFNVLRYPVVGLFVSYVAIYSGRLSGDGAAIGGFIWFLLWGVFFTGFQSPDLHSTLLPIGFLCLLLLYCCGAAEAGPAVGRVVFSYFLVFACLFSFANFTQIGNPNAYSYGKFQFTGLLDNPNAFGNLCAFSVIFMIGYLRFMKLGKFLQSLVSVSLLLLCFMIFLNFSRASLLFIFVGVAMMPMSARFKVILGLSGFVVVSLFIVIWLNFSPGELAFERRAILEETGRVVIFQNYMHALDQKLVVIGTGFSPEGGRIKSELAYLDLLLSTGVGAVGMFIFLLAAAFYSYRARFNAMGAIIWPLVAAMLVLGLVEGYLANVMSVLTIMFYFCAGVAYRLGQERNIKIWAGEQGILR